MLLRPWQWFDQGFEGNAVQFSVGRYIERVCRAQRRAQPAPPEKRIVQLSAHLLVRLFCRFFLFSPSVLIVDFGKALDVVANVLNQSIDLCCIPQINQAWDHVQIGRYHKPEITRRFPAWRLADGLEVVRVNTDKFDQRAALGQPLLDGDNIDAVARLLRALGSKLPVQLALQPLQIGLQTGTLLLLGRHLHPLRRVQRQVVQTFLEPAHLRDLCGNGRVVLHQVLRLPKA